MNEASTSLPSVLEEARIADWGANAVLAAESDERGVALLFTLEISEAMYPVPSGSRKKPAGELSAANSAGDRGTDEGGNAVLEADCDGNVYSQSTKRSCTRTLIGFLEL